MEPLPAQLLPVTAHIVFGIFNLATPNILAWAALSAVFFAAAWARLLDCQSTLHRRRGQVLVGLRCQRATASPLVSGQAQNY